MGKLGQLADRYKFAILAAWAAIIIFFAIFAFKLPSVLSGNGFEYEGTYNETREILEKDFGQPESTVILLFEKEKDVSEKEWQS